MAYYRKRENEKKRRKERRRVDEAYRERRNAIDAASRRRKAKTADQRPFVGCDGEGVRRGDMCEYVLFRMGGRELYHADERRLTTPELLQFIVDHPSQDDILVGFAFGYDINNILRDVPRERVTEKELSRLERVLAQTKAYTEGVTNPYDGFRWTWLNFDGYPQFGVSYMPRNHLRVCVAERLLDPATGQTFLRAKPKSVRTIYDVFGLFAASFLKTIADWEIGPEHWEGIKRMKDDRANFAGITDQIRSYCALECRLLADLMTAFRTVSLEAGIQPRNWAGAGKLAAALLTRHDVITRAEAIKFCPPEMITLAHEAYYGGRFEVTRIGEIAEPVTEHDINSAYPSAMRELPCLVHGRWIKTTGRELTRLLNEGRGNELFIAPVRFRHFGEPHLCGLPFRSDKGKLSWPECGRGVYWSPELRSAQKLGGLDIRCSAGYLYKRNCACRSFPWIEPLYEKRRKLGGSTKGKPIKLGLNSLYGKLAQRIGSPKWANIVHAGLITAITRSRLNEAIKLAGDQRRVVMIATDAIYTTGGPIEGLPIGKLIGQWGKKRFSRLFIVRPGLYWPPKPKTRAWKLKSRGLSSSRLEAYVPAFQSLWRGYLKSEIKLKDRPYGWGSKRGIRLPMATVPVTLELFCSLRLALHEGKPERACQWIERTHNMSFSWHDKRDPYPALSPDGKSLFTKPIYGSTDEASHSYDAISGKLNRASFAEVWDRIELEDHPDMIDMGPPFV
jgi:hypothetical protein